MKFHTAKRRRLNRNRLWLCAATALAGLAALPDTARAQDADATPTFWLTRAQNEARKLTDPAEKTGVFVTIGQQWLVAGDHPKAAEAAELGAASVGQIDDPATRFGDEMSLAAVFERADDSRAESLLSQAAATATAIPAGPARDDADHQLSEYHTVTGTLADARKPIDAITDPAQRAAAFANLADGYYAAGRMDDYSSAIGLANAAAAQISDAMQRATSQSNIVQTQVRDGDLNRAAQEAVNLGDPEAQGLAYAAMADAFVKLGLRDAANDAIRQMKQAALASSAPQRTALWLNVANVQFELGLKSDAAESLQSAVRASQGLEPADEADALSAAARLQAEAGDMTAAAQMAKDAASAARDLVMPADQSEVWMSVAAAQARCGMGAEALASIVAAKSAAAKIPAENRHPQGDPLPQAFLDVVQAAARAGDFNTALAVSRQSQYATLPHDAAIAVAAQQVELGQYQAAEETAARDTSPNTESSVCGIIAASLVRLRNPADADRWVARLNNASDKVAANLAVAQYLQTKTPPLPPPPSNAAGNAPAGSGYSPPVQ